MSRIRGRSAWRDAPLYSKIALTITVLVVATVAALTWVSMAREQSSYRAEMERQTHTVVEAVAISLQDALYHLDTSELAKVTERLVVTGLVEALRIYDPTGRVLTASDDPSLQFSLDIDPDGSRVAALDGPVSTWSPDRLLVERPILAANGEPLGGLAVIFSTAPLNSRLQALRRQGLAAALVALVAALLFAIPLTREVTRPLERLATMTEGLAGGDLGTPIEVPRGHDEAAILGSALENMRSQLQERYVDLEEQVAARTRELAESNAELEGKNAELERFTYTVSHDLRSPLITIGGFCDLARRALAKGREEEIEIHLERIAAAAATMERLLTELLELSRIGRVVNPPIDVGARELVSEAVLLVAGEIDRAGVTLEIHEDLPTVRVDRTRVIEVLENLLSNAIRATADRTEPRIEIGARAADDNADAAVLYVRDNGIGIEPENQERIFELFATLNGPSSGSGVGLAIVKRIVEVHGGRIWVESEGAGTGASFCFTLPAGQAAETAAPQPTRVRV